MPIVHRFVEDSVGKKIEHGIDPMECVASGAAVQAAVLTGDVKDVLLLDVTPLTLGIETLGSVRTPLIDKNTTIPVKKTQVFSTAADNQPAVTIHVLQGERAMAGDNVSLGKFDLDGIPPAPRGMPQIEVTFDIDANGLLQVSAKDLGTGKAQHITIAAPNKLSKADIDKFVKQAEQFSEQDKKYKEKVEAKNEADTVLYSTEKALKEHGDKVSADDRLAIERSVSELKEALKSDDPEKMRKAKEETLKVSQKLGEAIYKASQTKAGPGAGASAGGAPGADAEPEGVKAGAGAKEDIVDAEVVDEKKK